jgi:hypothetical protein
MPKLALHHDLLPPLSLIFAIIQASLEEFEAPEVLVREFATFFRFY